uniref:Mediator complex subunit 15 n=1 Tax=Strongyloides stercoralis TaxID=6248 RepID=A0A0K0E988_STRER
MNYGGEQQQNMSSQYVMQRVPQRIAPMGQNVPTQQRPQGQVINNQPQMVNQTVIGNGQRQPIQMGQGVPQGYYMQIQQNEPMQIGNQDRRQVPVQFDQRQNIMRQRMANNPGAQMMQQQQAQQIRMRTNINTGVNQPQIVYLQQGPGSVPTQISNTNSNAPIQLQRISSAHYQQTNQSSGSPMNIQHQTNYHNTGQNLSQSPPRGQVSVMYNTTTSGPSPQYNSALQAELRSTSNNPQFQHKIPHQNMMTVVPQHIQNVPQHQKEPETDKENPEYIECLNYIKQSEKKLRILVERIRLDGGNDQLLNNIEKILDIMEGKKTVTLQFLGKLKKTVENLIEKFDICKNMIKTSTMVAEDADKFKSFTIPHYDPFYQLKKFHSRMPEELKSIVPDNDPTPYYLRKNFSPPMEEEISSNNNVFEKNNEKELDEYSKLIIDENGKERLVVLCDNGRTITISNEATKELNEIGNFEVDKEAIPISDHCREVRMKITGSDSLSAFPLYLIIPVDYPETLCNIYYPFESPNYRNRYMENIKRNMEFNLARNSCPRTITEIASRWSTEVNNCFVHDWSFNGPTQNSVG